MPEPKYPKIVIDEDRETSIGDGVYHLTIEEFFDLMHHSHEGISGGQVSDLTERMLKLEAATGEYSAQVNGKSYETTADALVAAGTEGGTIKVLPQEGAQEIVDSVEVAPGAEVTLDFTAADEEGKSPELTVQREGTVPKSEGFKVEGTMTVEGGTIKNTGTSKVGIHYGVFAVENGGTLNLNGTEVDSGEDDAAVSIRDGGGTLNVGAESVVKGVKYGIAKYGSDPATIVIDGSVESTKASSTAVYVNSNTAVVVNETAKITSNDGPAIALNASGEALTVKEGATITGGDVGIGVLGGNVIIDGGIVKGTKSVTPGKREFYDGSAIWVQARYGASLIIKGGTFESTNAYGLYISSSKLENLSSVSIEGGKFTGKEAALKIPEGMTGFISGGEFSSKPEDAWLVKGYEATEGEGTWTVQEKASEE